jgi:DnaJ family protein C protein 13
MLNLFLINLFIGPYRVSELLSELDRGAISSAWYVSPTVFDDDVESGKLENFVDTGKWNPIQDMFQLKLQTLFPGKAMYSPAEISVKTLHLLQLLADLHKSANSKGVPFYPIPMSKKLMSDPDHLSIFSQLLLSNDAKVVVAAADLLRSLVEFNTQANSKLYLTGAFFFSCRYTGNNFAPISFLFQATHLQQSFHDAAASVARELPIHVRSVLGNILPQAMITMLHNYGPDRFATIFTGDFDTPEVIWNSELRRHLVELIDQHLGEFPARLRQFTLDKYEYCPIPKIHYGALDKDLYVHEYYLRNLCDEVKFPEWPIAEPLILLREAIERWRSEMSKNVIDTAVLDAKKLLKLDNKYDNAGLRKAYKALARQYHPDKNPNGRDMFEKIHIAYELLASEELQVNETNLTNVVLLLKTQIIVYRRFPKAIGDQKYPAFPLLISVLRIPTVDPPVEGVDAELIVAGTKLMYYTCVVSPRNTLEFVKFASVSKLLDIVLYATEAYQVQQTQTLGSELLFYAMKTFTAVSQIETGRAEILKLCPLFTKTIYSLLSLHKTLPIVVEHCIEVIARCCSLTELQISFVEAGVLWRLIPFLLAYDGTLNTNYADENQRTLHNQSSSNMHAITATKALGRLGGYMYDDLKSANNDTVKNMLKNLLTEPLSKLLRSRRPWDLLNALNENVEKVTKIWNVGMRQELLAFVLQIDSKRSNETTVEEDEQVASEFMFSALRDELCIGGVYVRIFNSTLETKDIDDPSIFCKELIKYISNRIKLSEQSKFASSALDNVHLDYAIEALRNSAEVLDYIPHDIAKHIDGIDVVFKLLEQPPDSPSFLSAVQLLAILCTTTEIIVAVSKSEPPCLWKLLRCICTVGVPATSFAWTAAESIASNAEGLDALLKAGSIIQLLGVLIGVIGYTKVFQSRISAISLLGKFLWNPVKGSDASNLLRRLISLLFFKKINFFCFMLNNTF